MLSAKKTRSRRETDGGEILRQKDKLIFAVLLIYHHGYGVAVYNNEVVWEGKDKRSKTWRHTRK